MSADSPDRSDRKTIIDVADSPDPLDRQPIADAADSPDPRDRQVAIDALERECQAAFLDGRSPFMQRIGTAEEVFDGIAEMTQEGWSQDHFTMKANGKLVNKRRSDAMKAVHAKNARLKK